MMCKKTYRYQIYHKKVPHAKNNAAACKQFSVKNFLSFLCSAVIKTRSSALEAALIVKSRSLWLCERGSIVANACDPELH